MAPMYCFMRSLTGKSDFEASVQAAGVGRGFAESRLRDSKLRLRFFLPSKEFPTGPYSSTGLRAFCKGI